MKKRILLSLALAVQVAFADGLAKTSPVDFKALADRVVYVDASAAAVKELLTSKLKVEEQYSGHLRLKAESFYTAIYQDKKGFPSQKIALDEVLAGKEADRSNFKNLLCGRRIDSPGAKQSAAFIGSNAAVEVAGGATSAGSGELALLGAVAGIVSALATKETEVVSCEQPVSVCKTSAYLCEWNEMVVTEFSLLDGDKVIGKTAKTTQRLGRGLHEKELAMQHMTELGSLLGGVNAKD